MNPFKGGDPNDPQNQMMLMSLHQVDEQNMVFFLMQNPDLVEKDDSVRFRKAAIIMGRNLIFMVFGGTFLNIQIKKIPKINFIQWHWLLRLPVRIPVFVSPLALMFQSVDEQMKSIFVMHQKYFRRIYTCRRTGDLKYIDPQGILAQQFEEKMRNI